MGKGKKFVKKYVASSDGKMMMKMDAEDKKDMGKDEAIEMKKKK